MLKIIYLLAICSFCIAEPTGLETVNDKRLTDLVANEKYVVVLFSKFSLMFGHISSPS